MNYLQFRGKQEKIENEMAKNVWREQSNSESATLCSVSNFTRLHFTFYLLLLLPPNVYGFD